ncbi:M48 family metallopeptidase [Arcanobacterium urinimassiliense]|uniref:M48 family metallopeptidase n=1 Tax=Arcanobacterium urinimassiliense TaxID=1871014 RepID=UPI000A06C823|nr:SprT family zinc-dependent metalloprotease [Arcanobacterium urinimassiliense]
MRNMYLRVLPPTGAVQVSAPYFLSRRRIEKFVAENIAQISRQRRQMQKIYPNFHYQPGELHYLWGDLYPLRWGKGKSWSAEKNAKEIMLFLPASFYQEVAHYEAAHYENAPEPNSRIYEFSPAEKKRCDRAFENFYRRELKVALAQVAEKYETLLGEKASEYRIRRMRTRWGSCNVDKRRIWINLQLAQLPPVCLEYVVIHELLHLKEAKHSPRFYALLEHYCPDWKQWDPNNLVTRSDFWEERNKNHGFERA